MSGVRTQVRRLVERFSQRPRARRVDWEGVYTSMREVPQAGPGFESDAWIEATRRLTNRARQNADDVLSDTQILATAIASRYAARTVRVLDFGGGMGVGFLRLRCALGGDTAVRYAIVEGQRVCAEGRKLVSDENVSFHTSFPDEEFDIVYAGSSLQYVEDIDAIVETFTAYRPTYVMLGDVPAGAAPSFWTSQVTVPGSRIAYHFLNVGELVDLMARRNYTLRVRGAAERPLNVETLPEGYRVGRPCNLLFEAR